MINFVVSDIQNILCVRTTEGHIQAPMEKALAEEETSKIGTSLVFFSFFCEAQEVKLALQKLDTLQAIWTGTQTTQNVAHHNQSWQ